MCVVKNLSLFFFFSVLIISASSFLYHFHFSNKTPIFYYNPRCWYDILPTQPYSPRLPVHVWWCTSTLKCGNAVLGRVGGGSWQRSNWWLHYRTEKERRWGAWNKKLFLLGINKTGEINFVSENASLAWGFLTKIGCSHRWEFCGVGK